MILLWKCIRQIFNYEMHWIIILLTKDTLLSDTPTISSSFFLFLFVTLHQNLNQILPELIFNK